MTVVLPIEYCTYCREHVPAGHECPYGPPKCPTDEGNPCGVCEACIAAQEAFIRAGSPSDLDTP